VVTYANAREWGKQPEELLLPHTSWRALVLDSMVSHTRQFQALCAFATLPARLRDAMLMPLATPPGPAALITSSGLPAAMCRSLTVAFNASQQTVRSPVRPVLDGTLTS
jgi:hypothetical protein